MARPQRDTPLAVDVNKWWWWYDDDGTYAFPNPIPGTKDHDKQQRCKSAHAKNRFVRQKYPIQTWYTQQQNSLANLPKRTWKKLIIVVQPRSPRRRRRRAVISRLPAFGAQSSIYARASRKSFFFLSLTLSAFAVGYSDSRARGQRKGASSSHCASDGWFFSGSSPAGQLSPPVLSHWEELRAWIILLAVFSPYYWLFLLWFHSCKPVGVEVIVWFADQCVARLRESATSCAFRYEPLSLRRRRRRQR